VIIYPYHQMNSMQIPLGSYKTLGSHQVEATKHPHWCLLVSTNLIALKSKKSRFCQLCQIIKNSAIPMWCPSYSESVSNDKHRRGLTDRGCRGWENIFSILLGFRFAPLHLSLFVLGRAEAAIENKNCFNNNINQQTNYMNSLLMAVSCILVKVRTQTAKS
jgi:hypothetical protein